MQEKKNRPILANENPRLNQSVDALLIRTAIVSDNVFFMYLKF